MSILYVNTIKPESGTTVAVTGTAEVLGDISASINISASAFYGDGTNVTGVTAEWDGSHTGNATIVGNLSGSGKAIFVTGLTTAGGLNVSGSSQLAGQVSITAPLQVQGAGSSITVAGNVSGSGKGIFVDELRTAGDLNVSGSTTLGNAAVDVVTVTSRLTASQGASMASNKKLHLGATEEYLYGDGTDIHIGVGSGGDINIPASIGLTFGNQGDRVEGDGSKLLLFGQEIYNSSGADITFEAGGGDVLFVYDEIQRAALKMNTANKLILSSSVSHNDFWLMSGRDIYLDAGGGDVKVTGNVSGSGKGIFVDELRTAGGLNVSGSSQLAGQVSITAPLQVQGAGSSITVAGNVSGSGKGIFVDELRTAGGLNVSGTVSLGSNTAYTYLVDTLFITGSTYTSGSITIIGGTGNAASTTMLSTQGDPLGSGDGFQINAGGGIKLSALSTIEFWEGAQSRGSLDLSQANDLLFKDNDGTEIFRIDGSADSLLMAGTKKIEFTTANAYIHHDGTDLKIADDADINLVAGVDILLDATGDIILSADGDNITMNDGTTTIFDFDVADPAFKIMDDAQVANYCSIAVGANGETTITTVDTDAAIAHLNFAVDGLMKTTALGVEIENAATAGTTALLIDNDATNELALEITAANIDANVVEITADAVTTATVFNISADGLTTGNALLVEDDSSVVGDRFVAEIKQNHRSAVSASCLKLLSEGGQSGMYIEKNYYNTDSVAPVRGMEVAVVKHGAATGQNSLVGADISIASTGSTNGVNVGYGARVEATVHHNADAGMSQCYGIQAEATGKVGSYGTQFVYGGRFVALKGDTLNVALSLSASEGGNPSTGQGGLYIITDNDSLADIIIADPISEGDDYFAIKTVAAGATTFTTVDDSAAAADLTFTIDGDIAMTAAGGDITMTSRTATATGAGITAATSVNPVMYVEKKNGLIQTTLLVDITGLDCGTAIHDVIGDEGASAAYLTQLTEAINGVVVAAEMFCIELPAGTNVGTDIDLRLSTASLAEDADASGGANPVLLIESDGAWAVGAGADSESIPSGADAIGVRDYYVYLTNGAAVSTGGTYTAGKFAILFYGWDASDTD